MKPKRWLLNILIAIDQLVNAIVRGDPDETLSSRAHRMAKKRQPYWGWTERFINALFFDRNHCRKAWESELKERQFTRPLK